ncbi:MAG TPA: sigma 54-interacting transcriptional regulator [Gemmatimonadaceae bacterium]|nr:sigma 54-interacting transcriptional regulator [Gemmatimonadaceae bacterium]
MTSITLLCFDESIRESATRAAMGNAPVLLLGETGSGKTALARLIHGASARSGRPFVRADCASIPDSLFEREMFGHTRGAFTDAKDSQPGLFEAAERGTLFLDEVGELPLAAQPKLLSVLDDGVVRRIGATTGTRIDVRIVAATNRDLPAMIRAQQFRADLYYRLGFLRIVVPPLRARRARMPELAAQLVSRVVIANQLGQHAPEIHPDAMALLQAYDWPGNVRELEQALTFAVTYFPSPVILPEHLPREVFPVDLPEKVFGHATTRYCAPQDPAIERERLLWAVTESEGNRTRAAKLLGMSRATLWMKLRQFGIDIRPKVSEQEPAWRVAANGHSPLRGDHGQVPDAEQPEGRSLNGERDVGL